MLIKSVCPLCGISFIGRYNYVTNTPPKYCSRRCRDLSRTTKKRIVCGTCEKPFYWFKTATINGRKFCSRKCYWKSMELLRGDKSVSWKSIETHCLICNKILYISPHKIKKGAGKYCSTKCMGMGQRGKRGHAWRGGLTPMQKTIRTSPQYKEWRDMVFKRDKYTCQICGEIGRILHAHHIVKFSTIISELTCKYPLLPISDMAKTNKELWEINNGVTLCKKCHKIEHMKRNKND